MRQLGSCAMLMLCGLMACTPESEMQIDESAAVRQIIEAHNSKLVRWYAAGQIDSVVTVFASDARQMGPNMEPLVGREAIRDSWRQATSWGTWTFELNTESVSASGPLAVEHGTYTLSFEPGATAPPGMAATADTGNYIVQWRREDGEWLIVNDIATSQISVATLCERQQ